MRTGIEQRDSAMNLALGAAERATPGWSHAASAYLERYCKRRQRFTTEELRTEAEMDGVPAPDEPRSWGGILKAAAHRKLIKASGFTEAAHGHAHARPVRVWESSLYQPRGVLKS